MTDTAELTYNAGMPREPRIDLASLTGRKDIDYGELCKEIRLESELTQVEMAEIVGLSVTGYGDLERGRSEPSGKVLLAILAVRAQKRGVNLKALFL